jgi:hypothetical protein
MHFLPVFELMSDSLMTIKVEPHQCPSNQSILLTQGPISEIFLRIGGFENLSFFEMAFLIFFFQIFFLLLQSHENQSKVLTYQEWVEVLMITLFSSQKSPNPNISAPSVSIGIYRENAYE